MYKIHWEVYLTGATVLGDDKVKVSSCDRETELTVPEYLNKIGIKGVTAEEDEDIETVRFRVGDLQYELTFEKV